MYKDQELCNFIEVIRGFILFILCGNKLMEGYDSRRHSAIKQLPYTNKYMFLLTEFCPQMTLPCEKGTAYPDPYSCQHFYYCDKNGEIRRYTCGANGWIRIVEGAALCGTQKLSTCDDNRPRRQCDSLNGYLPDGNLKGPPHLPFGFITVTNV